MIGLLKTKLFRAAVLLVLLIMAAVVTAGCTSDSQNTDSLPEQITVVEDEKADTETETEQDASKRMEITVFDVGKADAILITTENHTVLLDTGENKHGDEIAKNILNRGITEIDYLIITHFHKDHVGGAAKIIKRIPIKNVVVPDYGKESKHYDRFIEAMGETGIESVILRETIELVIDGAKLTVYPTSQEYYFFRANDEDDTENEDEGDESAQSIPQENNFSIAVSVNHGNNNFLFTGDAKSKRLKELLLTEDIASTEYDFLKVPHHGRYNKRSQEFIYTIFPKYAVITCSLDNPADKRVVAALENIGAQVFSTASGDVFCISDGETIKVHQ